VKTTDYRGKIRSIAEEREVRHLLHFTQFSNLREIVKHGLLSRDKLAGPEYMAYASDRYRLDGTETAVSVSISLTLIKTNTAMTSRACAIAKHYGSVFDSFGFMGLAQWNCKRNVPGLQ
jgi:hypothetical protein